MLRYWGFDFEQAEAVAFGQVGALLRLKSHVPCILYWPRILTLEKQRVLAGDTLEVKYFGKYDHWPEKYGAEAYFLHRVDLHNGLKNLALKSESSNPASKLNVSSEVVDLDCEAGTLTLANGKTYQKDFIVVADGVHVSKAHISTANEFPANTNCQVTICPES